MVRARERGYRYLINCAAAALLFLLVSGGASQDTVKPDPEMPWSKDMKKYPTLLTELKKLSEAIRQNVQSPPVRHQSALLALLPASTAYYAALPNYGEAARQALMTFRQRLQQSAVLRDWWQHGELGSTGPKVEESLEKFNEFSQYIGDEVVISGGAEVARIGEPGALKGRLLIVAEVRKPGLKEFLERMLKELPDKSTFRVLDPQELVRLKSKPGSQELLVLVRPDFVVAALNADDLRNFNTLLDAKTRDFPSTPFGLRLAQEYLGGTSAVMAADVHTLLSQIPVGTKQDQSMLDRTGFKDVKYAVWDYKHEASRSGSQMELSFMGPRHRVAAWLTAPARMGSLEFVSPRPAVVSAVLLKNLAEIFDDVKELATASNPHALDNLSRMEEAMQVNLRDDVLSQLQGEIAVELSAFEPQPEWRVILRVNDADRLQKALEKILATTPLQSTPSDEDGTTYHSLTIPSPQKPQQIVYLFADGYLIIASGRKAAAEGVRLHKSGESLARSAKLQESLLPGYPAEASALVYEDPTTLTALNLRRLSPELAETFGRLAGPTEPIVMRAYGEESAIRAVSTSGGADASAMLVVAAVAIPNLMRARTAANESSAIATMHPVVVAQVAYFGAYPEKGYAADLARLGPDPHGTAFHSPAHASFIDESLGNAGCTTDAWCAKSGYNFRLATDCKPPALVCKEFVVVGTPLSGSTGARSFCATSDGVVRYKFGPPLTSAIKPSECLGWAPLQ